MNEAPKVPNEIPDPTTFSELPPNTLEYVGVNESHQSKNAIYRDENKILWYEISKSVDQQMFLARLLKGLLPVSDVVHISPNSQFPKVIYLSKGMPLKNIKETHSSDESYAESTLFNIIFQETDRSGLHGGNVRSMKVGDDEYKTAHFDFQSFAQNFFLTKGESPEKIKEILVEEKDKFPQRFEHVYSKLKDMKKRFGEKEGLDFIRSVSESIPNGVNLGGTDDAELVIVHIHKKINKQIDLALKSIQEINESQSDKSKQIA